MCKVSAVIITCNEEHNLQMSLPKLTWCDEIVIVDSGSTDGTIQICRSYNCKVHYRKFDGYGKQKKYAIGQASNKWVLCLDADEVMSDELVEELKREMKAPSADGYYIPMVFVFMGKQFRHGKEGWRYFLRLFDRTKGGFTDHKIHEKIELNGNCKKLLNSIYHFSYRNFYQYFEKFNRYSSYGAEMAYAEGKKRSLTAIVFAVPLNFLKYYIVERNILNGVSGFYWSMLCAFYHFAKYIKLSELHRIKSNLDVLGLPDKKINSKVLHENQPYIYKMPD